MIKIERLSGEVFAYMIISGANNLYNNKKKVDDLNVFPVPDGDTGTNMSLTVGAMAQELKNNPNQPLSKIAEAAAFSTLRGARGNSGVILSQLFRGISKSLKGKEECSTEELSAALKNGSDAAYKAVMKPTEGTILTVARESATGAQMVKEQDIVKVVEGAVTRGNKALKKTTDMLPALKQANVVDAGGQGWMYVLEGALYYLKNGSIIEKETSDEPAKNNISQESIKTDDIKFRYCTEFLIEKKSKVDSAESFKNAISPKGDCMLVIDDEDIVKVHIHTNHPGFVIEEAIKLGELINLKIDNMKHQHKSIISNAGEVEEKKKVKVKAKKPEAPQKEIGIAAICTGKGMAAILKDMGVDRVIEGGQSMNPSTEDIIKNIEKINAKTVFVFPNNKNIIMAAKQAADIIEKKKVFVIESKNIPQCITALMSFNENKSAEDNEKVMTKALSKVKAGQVTYAVRDTEIEGITIKKDDIIGMVGNKICFAGKDREAVLEKTVAKMVEEDTEYITVYYGKDIKKAEAELMAKALESKYESDEIEVSLKKGGQPLYYYIISVE